MATGGPCCMLRGSICGHHLAGMVPVDIAGARQPVRVRVCDGTNRSHVVVGSDRQQVFDSGEGFLL